MATVVKFLSIAGAFFVFLVVIPVIVVYNATKGFPD